MVEKVLKKVTIRLILKKKKCYCNATKIENKSVQNFIYDRIMLAIKL